MSTSQKCLDVAVHSASYDATDNIFDHLVAHNVSFWPFSLRVSAVGETSTVVTFKGRVRPKSEFPSCCSSCFNRLKNTQHTAQSQRLFW